MSHELDTEIGRCMALLSHHPEPAEEKRIRARLSRLSRTKRRMVRERGSFDDFALDLRSHDRGDHGLLDSTDALDGDPRDEE